MSKTVITKEIDGYNIILGFSTLQIDPEGTKAVVLPQLEESDEKKALVSKYSEIQTKLKAKQDSAKASAEAYKSGNTSLHAKHSYDVELRIEQINTLSDEAKTLNNKLMNKKTELWNDNLTYFEPKAGEIAIEDKKHVALSQAYMDLEDGYLLDVDGNAVLDKRGTKYVKDGKVVEVTKLGEDIDGLLLSEVTTEEFETMRIENLTADELKAEVENAEKSLLSQANTMRGELEILGDEDALTKSQEWYKTELEKLEVKYTV